MDLPFKIVVTNCDVDVSKLNQIGIVFQYSKPGLMARKKLIEEIADADALFCVIVDKIDKEVLDNAKKLKVISTLSVGYNHIDINECKKRKIKIGFTPHVLTEATSELCVSLLLATSRRIIEASIIAKTCEFQWNPFFMCGKQLLNSTVGIYGLGNIGKSIAEKLLSFKIKKIIYHNRSPRADVPKNYLYVSFLQLITESDFLLICANSTSENSGIFNLSTFKKMKNDLILINVSRGFLINHEDLYQALKNNEIGAAGLDVTDPEPLPLSSPLHQLQNCVILPHIGSATFQTRRQMVDVTIIRMNARNQQFQLIVDCRQVRDVTLCAFHTILLHRTIGKFKYTSDQNFSFGLLGYEDVQCNNIDLTYVRVNSPELIADLNVKINDFSYGVETMISNGYFLYGSSNSQYLRHSLPGREGRLYGIESWETLFPAQIKLEFYQKRRRQWPIPEDHVPWEIWELQLEIVRTNNDDFQRMKEFVGEKLSETVLSVCETINKPQYLPKMPTRAELPFVFGNRFRDCSPYLYRIESQQGTTLNDTSASRGNFVRKLLSDTLAFTAS